MSVEAMLGTDRGLRRRSAGPAPATRTGHGGGESALPALPVRPSSRRTPGRTASYVQDAYSMRCAPQVAGAARDTLAHARTVAGYELASAVDNPVVTLDGRVESNGNFHGAPVAYVLDFLAIPVADVASMSERRTDRMLDVARSRGLPPFLAARRGRRLRIHDRPVHAGRGRVRTQAIGRAGVRRLDPVERDAGGPRLDGLVGRPKATPSCRRPDPGAGHRTAHRGARPRPARATRARTGHGGCGCGASTQRRWAGTGSFLAPEIAAAVAFVRSGTAVAAANSALPAPLG